MPPAHQQQNKSVALNGSASAITNATTNYLHRKNRNMPLKDLPRSARTTQIRDFEDYTRGKISNGLIEDEVVLDDDNPMLKFERKRTNPPSSSSRFRNSGQYSMPQNDYAPYGMGLGYGYGGISYGMYGMGMGGMAMGPFAWLSYINYVCMHISQIVAALGMSSHVVFEVFSRISAYLKQVEISVRQSSLRHWVQQKSKKSKLLRTVFVLVSVALGYHSAKIFKVSILKIASFYTGASHTDSNRIHSNVI